MVQKCLKLKPRLEGHWTVGIQAVGYAFKNSRVLIQAVGPSFTHLAAAGGDSVVKVKYQSASSIKTILSSDVIKRIQMYLCVSCEKHWSALWWENPSCPLCLVSPSLISQAHSTQCPPAGFAHRCQQRWWSSLVPFPLNKQVCTQVGWVPKAYWPYSRIGRGGGGGAVLPFSLKW